MFFRLILPSNISLARTNMTASVDSSNIFRVDGIVAIITGGGSDKFSSSHPLHCISHPHVISQASA
jgi:hypothetical protein